MELGRNKINSRKGYFLKGPIDWEWISAAAKLPGKALHVAIAISMCEAINKKTMFRLSRKWLNDLGVGRSATYRALHQLERLEIIKVERSKGRLPIINVIRQIPIK